MAKQKDLLKQMQDIETDVRALTASNNELVKRVKHLEYGKHIWKYAFCRRKIYQGGGYVFKCTDCGKETVRRTNLTGTMRPQLELLGYLKPKKKVKKKSKKKGDQTDG